MPYKVKLSSKNQITLPVDVLKELGMKAGETILIYQNIEGRWMLGKQLSMIRDMAGSVGLTGDMKNKSLDVLIAESRDKAMTEKFKKQLQTNESYTPSKSKLQQLAEPKKSYNPRSDKDK